MKISKNGLQQIIKEEIEGYIRDSSSQNNYEDEYEGRMAKGNLYSMVKNAKMLHNMIKDGQNLEPWVEEKIAVAADAIKTVAEYMEYENVREK